MPYNILIVDDEFLIKNKLQFMREWEKYGFKIVGEVDNGKLAIDFIDKNPVDIVITDVCMPVMDGVALTKYLCENRHNIKVIVMSSYDDFEYVKETLKIGAKDYILKHKLDKNNLMRLLMDIKKDIENEKAEDLKSKQEKEKLSISSSLIKQRYIKNLILGLETPEHEINLLKSEYGKINTNNTVIAIMKINNFSLMSNIYSEKDLNNILQNITNISSQAITNLEDASIIYLEQGSYILFLPFKNVRSETKIQHIISGYIRQIDAAVKKYFNLTTTWGISPLSNNKLTIHKCYIKAYEALKRNPNSSISNMDNYKKRLPTLSIKDEKELLAALETFDTYMVNMIIDKIFDSIEPTTNHRISLEMIIGELIAIATKACSEFDIDIKKIYYAVDSNNDLIKSSNDINKTKEWLKKFFNALIELQNTSNHSVKYSNYIQLAIKYIEKNYSKNLSLNDIAKEICISPPYLSKLFKNETGEKLSHFLTAFRIEKAKQLIERGEDNIKYLSSKIGFNNYNYFFTAFKKYVGITPLEYSKKYKNNK